jgi:hypothetical protein
MFRQASAVIIAWLAIASFQLSLFLSALSQTGFSGVAPVELVVLLLLGGAMVWFPRSLDSMSRGASRRRFCGGF